MVEDLEGKLKTDKFNLIHFMGKNPILTTAIGTTAHYLIGAGLGYLLYGQFVTENTLLQEMNYGGIKLGIFGFLFSSILSVCCSYGISMADHIEKRDELPDLLKDSQPIHREGE